METLNASSPDTRKSTVEPGAPGDKSLLSANPAAVPSRPASASDSLTLGLVEFLASRDVPCPSCGYNLRGLVATVCPECNQELQIRVGLRDPRLGVWITAVIVQAIGVGFTGLLCLFVLVVWIFRRSPGPPPAEVFSFALVPCLAQMPFLIALLARGKRIRRSPALTRWGLLALATLLTITSFLVFSLNVK
ncbi:MAG: hypothetical protein SFZ23_01940 [Planctomycetota bacterium]|nr:hypothetical protein [Planctomycetota bacterium]